MALVWESRELMAVRTAFRRLLARSASIQTIQLALYATVSGMLCSTLLIYLIFSVHDRSFVCRMHQLTKVELTAATATIQCYTALPRVLPLLRASNVISCYEYL